jgi:hypothetical protein
MATLARAHPPAPPPAAPRIPWLRPVTDVARVFAHEPDLLAGLGAAEVDVLRRRATAPKHWLDPGPWPATEDPAAAPGRALGLLVLDGLVMRTVRLDGRECPELVGAGDLLRPWDQADDDSSLGGATTWDVVLPTTVAVLDAPFAGVVARHPAVMGNLLARAVRRTRFVTLQLAIVHVRSAETRLLMLLWHLADRWGRVTPGGVHLPLPLKHELLAQLTCMRRPTASSALSRLQRTGELARCPDGSWLLLGTAPAPAGPV